MQINYIQIKSLIIFMHYRCILFTPLSEIINEKYVIVALQSTCRTFMSPFLKSRNGRRDVARKNCADSQCLRMQKYKMLCIFFIKNFHKYLFLLEIEASE